MKCHPSRTDPEADESVRRFKGLERPVVVLVELPASGNRLDELLYVGLTRATTELVVITPPELAARLS
jgi:superfamily I DNA/RNA helicase